MDRMLGHASQHVGEPGLWIDVVELRGLYQRCRGGSTLGPTRGAREQLGFSAEGKTSERSLGSIGEGYVAFDDPARWREVP